jgi:hypothetical protein
MEPDRRQRRRGHAIVGPLAVSGWLAAGAGSAAAAVPIPRAPQIAKATPSDSRATFVSGNVTTCAAVGFPNALQVGESHNASASDANVAGTPAVNAGPTQPGQGEEVNVAALGANVTIDAIVVKGGPAYNVYTNPAVLPPTLPAGQHYISPLNPGGNVPALSHWFICYHHTTPPPPGSLTIDVTVDDPNGIPAAPLPAAYTVVVNCNDGVPAHQNVTLTYGPGGGEATGSVITGIPPNTVCTVVEQGTASLPPGTTVTETPGADTTGVTITANAAATVHIIDNEVADPLETASLQLTKVLVAGAPPGLTLPTTYPAHASCDDGTETDVTLPGAGGTGTPVVTVPVLTDCLISEDTTGLPSGWVVTYTVTGGTPTTALPTATLTATGVLDVTITNDPTAVTTPPSETTEPTAAPTMPATLPPTGASTDTPLILGAALLAVGLVAIGYTTKRRAPHP